MAVMNTTTLVWFEGRIRKKKKSEFIRCGMGGDKRRTEHEKFRFALRFLVFVSKVDARLFSPKENVLVPIWSRLLCQVCLRVTKLFPATLLTFVKLTHG